MKLLERAFNRYNSRGWLRFVSDTACLKILYHMYSGKKLNLSEPKTYNEKIQWLKLNDRNDAYPDMVDKQKAKEYVASVIGDEYIIPTLGVWSAFRDIDFDHLPDRFVLKCTHDSGSVIICKDKSSFDYQGARKKVTQNLKRNLYWTGREWPYKNLEPRVLAEKYMCDNSSDDNLTDYKIFCFDGVPKYIMTVRDRQKGRGKSLHRWYDTDWNLLDVDLDHRNEPKYPEPKPDQLNKMIEIATKLSSGLKHCRIDLYVIDEKIYFGEITLYHASGFENWEPAKWDEVLGAELDLSDML